MRRAGSPQMLKRCPARVTTRRFDPNACFMFCPLRRWLFPFYTLNGGTRPPDPPAADSRGSPRANHLRVGATPADHTGGHVPPIPRGCGRLRRPASRPRTPAALHGRTTFALARPPRIIRGTRPPDPPGMRTAPPPGIPAADSRGSPRAKHLSVGATPADSRGSPRRTTFALAHASDSRGSPWANYLRVGANPAALHGRSTFALAIVWWVRRKL